ncbi:MAG: MIP/aquaporin family protein [Candidatus Methylomirabilales bacterium]
MRDAMSRHWPEYLLEGAGLGAFMLSACAFATLLQHPASPVRQAIPDAGVRRALMGLAMGFTAIGLIYSPWGRRSGAHLNPAVTLAFWWLGKVRGADAVFYIVAQFLGALLGVLIAAAGLGGALSDPAVNFAVTSPGPGGPLPAFLTEFAISGLLMLTVLIASNAERLARFTGLLAGLLVAAYIVVAAPVSGMSMNPARSLASAIPAEVWTALWIYFTAPVLGMLLAAGAYGRVRGRAAVRCAKLMHAGGRRCIFRCGYPKP